MLKGTITDIKVQDDRQINVDVTYEDSEVGFKKKSSFTVTSEEVDNMTSLQEGLETIVKNRGQEFKIILDSKTDFEGIIGKEITI